MVESSRVLGLYVCAHLENCGLANAHFQIGVDISAGFVIFVMFFAICNVLKNVPCSGVEFGINFFACCADAFEFKPRYSVVFTDQCDGN